MIITISIINRNYNYKKNNCCCSNKENHKNILSIGWTWVQSPWQTCPRPIAPFSKRHTSMLSF